MSLLLLPEDSYRRKLTSVANEPRSPALTDTGWGPMVSAALETMSDMHNVTNGQLLIGYSSTAALTTPTVAPDVTSGTSGAIPDGTYYLKYSYTNVFGETLTGPAQTITLSGGGTNSFYHHCPDLAQRGDGGKMVSKYHIRRYIAPVNKNQCR
jgi:hypothetical protein